MNWMLAGETSVRRVLSLGWLGFALLVNLCFGLPAHADDCRVPYEYPPLDYDRLKESIATGVLHINGSDSGTAFLIDRDRGIYLTAAHVLLQEVAAFKANKPQSPITGRNNALSDDFLRLKVIGVDADADLTRDLAILQLDGAAPPADSTELHLALRDLNGQEDVRFMGYGVWSERFPDPRMSDPESRVEASPDPILYRFGAGVTGGDSGGPVFLPNGSVIGMMIEQQSGQSAVFHSLAPYMKSLMQLKPALRDDRLIPEIFSAEPIDMRRERMTRMLAADAGDEAMSNLELAAAIAELDREQKLAEIHSDILDCPLYLAAAGRDLGMYGLPIMREKWRREMITADAASILIRAQGYDREGNALLAATLYDLAAEKYRTELASMLAEQPAQKAVLASLYRAETGLAPLPDGNLPPYGSFPGALASISGSLGLGKTVETVIDADPGKRSGLRKYGSDTLSVTLHDYGLALMRGNQLRASYMGEDFPKTDALQWAVSAGALGAAVAYKPVWTDLNVDLMAKSVKGLDLEKAGLVAKAVEDPTSLKLFGIGTGDVWTDVDFKLIKG